jgi:hypothetical protein
MALKQETVEIDGHKYNMTQLGALEGRRLVVRLSKALAPMLGSFAEHEKLTEGAVMAALSTGIESLDEQLTEELCNAFTRRTLFQHQEQWVELERYFDQHFAGRYGSLLRWMLAHLKLNFADFLGDKPLTGALSAIRGVTTGSSSPTPTPSSGESS